jgi:CxxC-x17-CxxC domain-containing protein
MRDFSKNRRFGKNSSRRRNSGRNNRGSPRRFERDSGRPGKGNFGRSDFGNDMFPAICDKCGERCELPFKPRGEKPVYCSNCYKKVGKSESKGIFNNERFAATGPNAEFGKELFEINKKLDIILEALTKR